MEIKQLEHDIIKQDITGLTGLSGHADVSSTDIDKYFYEFMDWLEWNHVLDVVNKYANIHMNLQYVTKADFVVWILHFGDVYENLANRYAAGIFKGGLDDEALSQLRLMDKKNPQYSYLVALTHKFPEKTFLSDNDLDSFLPVLANIPDNTDTKPDDRILSDEGAALYHSLYLLSNYAIERVAENCF